MNKAIELSKNMVGKKVKLIEEIEEYGIPIDTLGTIICVDEYNYNDEYNYILVEWEIFDNITLWVQSNLFELIDKSENEEIWDMLLPTLEKLGLEQTYIMGYGSEELYEGDVIHEVISEIYKLAYERGRQGKDFMIEE